MFCLKCGNKLEDGMMFCNKCGTRAGNVPNAAASQGQALGQRKFEQEKEKNSKVQQDAASLQHAPREKKAVKKKRDASEKKKNIFIKVAVVVVMIAVLAGGIAVSVQLVTKALEAGSQTQTVNQIVAELEEGDYEAAIELYEENYKYNETPEELIAQLKERLSAVWISFTDGTATYTQVMKEMDAFQKMNVSALETDVEELLADVEELNASRTAFSTANTLMEEGDYVGAIEQYDLVIETDSDYSTALTKREEAVNAYRQSVLEEASEYANKEDYTAALAALNGGLENLPNDTALTEQVTVYTGKQEEQKKQSYITKTKQYGDNGDYLKAVQTLQAGLGEYAGNAEMTSMLSTYLAVYVDEVVAEAEEKIAENAFSAARSVINNALKEIGTNNSTLEEYLETIDEKEQKYIDGQIEEYLASADAYVSEKDYDSAISVIQDALLVYTDSEELKDKLEELEEKKPVALGELTISETFGFGLDTDLLQDTIGNYYSGTNVFRMQCYSSDKYGYIKIYIGGDYKTISGVIACLDSTGLGKEAVATIYGDEKLLYTSSVISRASTPQKFDVDITGVEWMTIRYDKSSTGTFAAVLSNCILEK